MKKNKEYSYYNKFKNIVNGVCLIAIIVFGIGLYFRFGSLPNEFIKITDINACKIGEILISFSMAIFVAYILKSVVYRKARYEKKIIEEKCYYEKVVKEFEIFYNKNCKKFNLSSQLKPRDRCLKEIKLEEVEDFICDMSNVIDSRICNFENKYAHDFIKEYKIFIEQILKLLERNRTCFDFSKECESIMEEAYENCEALFKLVRLAKFKLKMIVGELNKFKSSLL